MKKIIIPILVAAVFAITACEKEHDKGYYDKVDRIYFGTDSVNFSLGAADPTVEIHYYDYPVKKMGLPAEHDTKFRISVVADKTNAVAGEHYVAFEREYVMPKGEMETVVPIGLIKNNLREDEYIYRLTFKMEPTDDFELGAKELVSATLTFNNFLEEPVWWEGMFNLFVVKYRPSMLAILVAEMGDFILDFKDQGEALNYVMQIRMTMKLKVYDYAVANPEYAKEMGWEFIDNAPWPYN